jgi:hypothetical protein
MLSCPATWAVVAISSSADVAGHEGMKSRISAYIYTYYCTTNIRGEERGRRKEKEKEKN